MQLATLVSGFKKFFAIQIEPGLSKVPLKTLICYNVTDS